MTLFPPCRSTLIQNIKRSHCQTAVWCRSLFQKPVIPDPCNVIVERRLKPPADILENVVVDTVSKRIQKEKKIDSWSDEDEYEDDDDNNG